MSYKSPTSTDAEKANRFPNMLTSLSMKGHESGHERAHGRTWSSFNLLPVCHPLMSPCQSAKGQEHTTISGFKTKSRPRLRQISFSFLRVQTKKPAC